MACGPPGAFDHWWPPADDLDAVPQGWPVVGRHFGAKGVPSILVFVCHQRRVDLLRARDDRHEGAADQDAVLSGMERNVATGFSPDSAPFFNMVRTHTIQGTFCDPYYGGNANFIGWDLIGYPGIRM